MSEQNSSHESMVANATKEILNRIYDGFLLKDLLSKIVPGVILISVINTIAHNELVNFVVAPHYEWLFFIGLSWATGFTLQSFGEAIGFISSWPRDQYNDGNQRRGKRFRWKSIFGFIKNEKNIGHWYSDYFNVINYSKTGPHEKTYIGRFGTALDVVNNLSLSVFLSSLLLIGHRYFESCNSTYEIDKLAVLLLVLSSFSLVFATRIYRDRLFRSVKKSED